MTAAAIASDIRVIEVRRYPTCRSVTVVAIVARVQMCRVFPCCCDAVVAGAAGADDLGVVDRESGRPDIRVMAVLADIAGLDVSRALTGRLDAVVTAHAVARDIDMVEVGRRPAGRRVAIVAVVAARNVCRVFANCRNAIMTGTAGAEYLGVVHRESRLEADGIVTVFTHIGGLYVHRALARSRYAVVAADAVVNDPVVVEYGRNPGCRIVAVIALIARRDMGRRFAGRLHSVVAAVAASDDRRVIHENDGRPARRYVTVRALAGRCDVVGGFE